MYKNIIIISGGQSGADRAGLDSALLHGFKIEGYIPKNGLCEDNFDLKRNYPTLVETNSSNYSVRTNMNVKISDIGLIFRLSSSNCPGTNLTIDYYKNLNKEFIVVDKLNAESLIDVTEFVKEHLNKPKPLKINIAGIRESNNPGTYRSVFDFLNRLFSEIE